MHLIFLNQLYTILPYYLNDFFAYLYLFIKPILKRVIYIFYDFKLIMNVKLS